MTIPSRSLRLTPKNDYTRFTGNRGEIFYDPVNNTLRVFDSQLAGGHIVATRSWVTTQLPSVQGLASVAYVNQAIAAIPQDPEYLLKIAADDSTVLAVGRDETLQVRGEGSITTTISTDSTGIQLLISAPEVSNNNIDVNAPLGSASLVPTERAVKAYADLLFNLQTQQLQNGTLDITAASLQLPSGVAVTAGILGGHTVSMNCERNSTGAIGQIMSFGNGSTAGKGLRMPAAGRLIAATLAGTGINGTLTVQAYLNGVANASYELTQTNGSAADVGVTGNFASSPLLFSAGDTLGWYQASLPTASSVFNVNFYVSFDPPNFLT